MDTFNPTIEGTDLGNELNARRGGFDRAPKGQDGIMRFSVQHPAGHAGYVDEHDIAGDLQQMGYQVSAVSPDGMMITIADHGGNYQVPVTDVVQKLGWQVKDAVPRNPDQSMLSPSLRYAISQPMLAGDEAAKVRYLQHSLMKQGIPNPQIVGRNNNYSYYDPQQQKYFALTDAPGVHMTDFSGAAAKAPGVAGAVVGGTLAAPSAFGTGPVGPMLGAAGGGLAGDALSTGIASAIDPDFREALGSRQGLDIAKDVGTDAALNAVGGGLAPWGIGKIGKAMGIGAGGALSSVAKPVGKTMQAGGELLGNAGEFLATSPVARDIGLSTMGAPGVNEGWLMEAAGDAPGAIAKGADWMRGVPARASDMAAKTMTGLGRHPAMNAFNDEAAASLRQLGGSEEARAAKLAMEHNARPPVYQPGATGSEQMSHMASRMGAGPGGQEFAGKIGQTMQNMGQVGKVIQKPAQAAWQATTRTAQGVGRGAQYGGKALNAVGEAMSPYETGIESRLGAEELYSRLKQRQRALQAQGFDPKLVPDSQLAEFEPASMPQHIGG